MATAYHLEVWKFWLWVCLNLAIRHRPNCMTICQTLLRYEDVVIALKWRMCAILD